MKQLIVLGNGFDKACKLKGSYDDFFFTRFKELFCSEDTNFKTLDEMTDTLKEKRISIFSNIKETKEKLNFSRAEDCDYDYFKLNSNTWSNNEHITRWDIIFLFAQSCIGNNSESYEWHDVESIIFEVISIALNVEYKSKVNYKSDVWSPVNKIDNLNRDFFVLCHD